jgi:hypothetical protein
MDQEDRGRPRRNVQRPIQDGHVGSEPILQCSHCGKEVTYQTFRVNHYQNWDHNTSTWSITKNGWAKKPNKWDLTGPNMHAAFRAMKGLEQEPMEEGNNEENDEMMGDEMEEVSGEEEVYEHGEDNFDDFDEHEEDRNFADAIHGDYIEPRKKWSPSRDYGFAYALQLWATTFGVTEIAVKLLIILLVAFTTPTLSLFRNMGVPVTQNSLRSVTKTGYGHDDFKKLSVCPGCSMVVEFEKCFSVHHHDETGRIYHTARECERKTWSNNKQIMCKKQLCRIGEDGRAIPLGLIYPYLSIAEQMEEIVNRLGVDILDDWKKRNIPEGTYGDIYEGSVWKEFQTDANGKPFLSEGGIGLLLNTDGFQPFDWIDYSVVGIYLAILNLPRELRYLRENMIVVGLVPGGKESIGLQSFMCPMVDELIPLWDVETNFMGGRRVALLCLAADMPATAKMTGLAGHGAIHFGVRSITEYPHKKTGSATQVCYGSSAREFDVPWPCRFRNLWIEGVEAHMNAKTGTERDRLFADSG